MLAPPAGDSFSHNPHPHFSEDYRRMSVCTWATALHTTVTQPARQAASRTTFENMRSVAQPSVDGTVPAPVTLEILVQPRQQS